MGDVIALFDILILSVCSWAKSIIVELLSLVSFNKMGLAIILRLASVFFHITYFCDSIYFNSMYINFYWDYAIR